MAGGIGVTPLVAMAEHLWHTGAPFDLHYCVRTPERAAFLGRLQKSPYRSRVHLWCSRGGASGRMDMAKSIARVPRLSQLYVCGPASFMDAAQSAAMQVGWDPARIHRESFEDTPGCQEG
jgi:vanillate O-demethylase ferredoxin subunit